MLAEEDLTVSSFTAAINDVFQNRRIMKSAIDSYQVKDGVEEIIKTILDLNSR